MIRLLFKKQILHGGWLYANSGEMILGILYLLGGLFGMMLSFYICSVSFNGFQM